VKLPEAVLAQRLEHWPVARLATVAANGRPQQVPIVFARIGALLWTPVDGKAKSGRELARVRNLRERPQASVLLDEYADDWQRLWWIAIEGSGRVVRPDAPGGDTEFEAATAALRAKYPQYAEVPLTPDLPTLIAIRIERIRSWCAS
jgi:PPOX class probable F420-dependent enzyme